MTVGAGHNAVAKTLEQYFQDNGHQTYTIDIFKNNKFTQEMISGFGFKAMYKFPHIANVFFNKAKRTNHSFYEKSIDYTKKYNLHQINDFTPDIIISTHIAGLLFTQKYRQQIEKPFKNCFIMTDYDLTPSLFNDNNKDIIIVPNQEFKQQLEQKGFSSDNIFSCGIPINPKFFKKNDKEVIAKKLSLENFDTTKPTILFMGGGKGLGKIYSTIKFLVKNTDAQFVVVCGKNQKLKKKIDSIKPNNVFCFGYVNFIDELMDLSDYIFGKTGGLSSTEALAKQLLILSYKNIPCPEYSNLMYLAQKKLAFYINNKKEILGYLQNPSKSINDIAKPDTCQQIYNALTK